MSTNSDFLQRFEEFVGASRWRTVSTPTQLLEHWNAFVAACEEGYADTIYDYENERSVRDLLESALQDPVLKRYEETVALRDSVLEIDARFRAACRDDVELGGTDAPWWRRSVPKKAEGDFAEDLMRLYGIGPT